jgi:hypothetical protein
MAVATVVEILDEGDLVGFELDNESVVWGDARKMRSAIAACGLQRGDVIDYQLADTGGLADFRVVRDEE